MSSTLYLVKGAGTDVQPRLEIHELIKEKEQFTLFVLGWNKIREPDYDPPAANYGKQAGIHGMPYEPWIGDPEGEENLKVLEDGKPFGGYCNHASVLFPTWHRPSLMLLEQSIWEAAKKEAERIAADHPQEAKVWLEASHKLRFPYWDWTNPGETKKFPQIFRDPEVKLYMPEGKIEERPNPLHTYKLGSPLPDGFKNRKVENSVVFPKDDCKDNWPCAYFGQWNRTYRWPSDDSVNPTEKIETLDHILNGGKLYPNAPDASWIDLQNKVNSLFLYPSISDMPQGSEAYAWDKFSNTRAMSQPNEKKGEWEHPGTGPYWDIAKKLRYLSPLEASHNLLHLLIGGLGHMMDNDFASFDPIFFLHHCNVDRILALWENAYPYYYMGQDGYKDKDGEQRHFKQAEGKWGWPNEPGRPPNDAESTVNLKGDTPLTPFRKGDGTYWTSDDARWGSKVAKNYTYKDIHLSHDLVDPLVTGTRTSLKLSLADPNGEHMPTPSEAELRKNRAVLQRLFGFNPVPVRQLASRTLSASNQPKKELTYPDSVSSSPGYEPILDYRHYVVSVCVDPYAFGISYSVNIRYHALNIQTGEIIKGHIGSASSLVRSETTRCSACQARKDETKAVYYVTIPHEVIAQIASHVDEFDTLPLLLKSLSADITLPDGYIIANTPTDISPNAIPLPEKFVPEIRLISAALQALPDGTNHVPNAAQDHAPLTPYETHDWREHNVLFPHQSWAAVQAYE